MFRSSSTLDFVENVLMVDTADRLLAVISADRLGTGV